MNQHRRTFLTLVGSCLIASIAPFSAQAAETGDKVKIGIVGSGNVGSALGSAWVRAGHEVMFSSRHIEHDRSLAESLGSSAHAGTPREAATFGDVVVVAVPYHALPDVGKELGDVIAGKVVIDTCNPFPGRDGEIADWALEKGAGLAGAELLPDTRLVRAFNAVGAARMGSASEDPERVGMPIAGNDAEALEMSSRLIREIGFEPVVVGGLDKGRYLRPGTPLAGERSAEEIRRIAAELE